jgi:sugar O-acyltransferase (sialic acid O-acetyltransferase NeuD family)
MNKNAIVLIGAGGHSRACIDVIERVNEFKIAGLVGKQGELGTVQCGHAVIAVDDDLPSLAGKYPFALVAVGQIESPALRAGIYERALASGFEMPSIVSPTAYVSPHATIGKGSIVMHGAIVNAGARIGINCIINSGALVEHDVSVGDHCHISTNATLNGSVKIGAGSFVGSGSVIRDQVSIGEQSIIGMGLCVRHDCSDYTRFTGQQPS